MCAITGKKVSKHKQIARILCDRYLYTKFMFCLSENKGKIKTENTTTKKYTALRANNLEHFPNTQQTFVS